ncbi:protein FAR1-RELATED SEQUENCE 9-like [Humulus lupulus]|uniref:protein FAR1-RELATED SEQUENCE 9-like n=1 Tax=Humulus lupulus TaxID=3486 RepID=UPI002B409B6C|nr:protein FAR1-RELATED SEQUENCE 9-like [Humulus lupulus]
MHQKTPSVVITDGDKGMREAISTAMPNAYETRRNWAETFLRNHFVAGSRTTQRSESTNSYLNQFLTSKLRLSDFIGQIDVALQTIRHNEMHDDFRRKHSSPQLPNHALQTYHQQFATYYTRNMYDKVAAQIMDIISYKAMENVTTIDSRVFSLERFPTGLVHHTVTLDEISSHLKYTCLLFETDGIPCRHMFAVMKNENMQLIPPTLIKDRWHKDARTRLDLNVAPHSRVPTNALETTRWRSLTSAFTCMAHYTTKHEDTYEEAKKQIAALASRFNTLCQQCEIGNDNEESRPKGACTHDRIVRDPAVVKTKGRAAKKARAKENDSIGEQDCTRKQKRCCICNQLGHNRSTCKYKNQPTPNTKDISQPVLTRPKNSKQTTLATLLLIQTNGKSN